MGTELFHADANEKNIRILGKEKGISPRKINIRIVLWDIDENGELKLDPETGEAKTITIEKYIKSIDIEKPIVKYVASIKIKDGKMTIKSIEKG